MTLLNVLGDSFTVPEEDWVSMLAQAQSYGWTPGGTRVPALVFEGASELWSGAYSPARGQEVTRRDASALAEWLVRLAERGDDRADLLGSVAEFCRRGGFLICETESVAHSNAGLRNLFDVLDNESWVTTPTPERVPLRVPA